ncbi:DUF5677 domain-containing protein [Gracilibacillus saliphilus]|uniref:DUF5677 domain-containing protein n=1 Tax=Gracilibacillus saliphilus TaxID=543890 RepID=UPI0013D46EAF|nr:DUF5677 domain-containing protein [Gracilibacillus saliphilus]
MKMLKKVLKEAHEAAPKVVEKALQNRIDIPEAVTLAFFEDMLKKIESFVFLIENDQDTSIDIVTRSVFENYIYLRLLLSKDNKILSRSYMLRKKYKEIKLYENIISSNKTGRKIRAFLPKLDVEKMKQIAKYGTPEHEIEKLKKEFSDVLEKRQLKHNWYDIYGNTKNIEQLCFKLEMHAEYELIYTSLSKEVHSMDIMKRWRIEGQNAYLLNTTESDQFNSQVVSMFLLETIRNLYEFYNLRDDLKKFNTLIKINYQISNKNFF